MQHVYNAVAKKTKMYTKHTCAPFTMDWKLEPERRFTENAGASIGTPTLKPACRAMKNPSLEVCRTQRHDTQHIIYTKIQTNA